MKTDFIYIDEIGRVIGFDENIYKIVDPGVIYHSPVPVILPCLNMTNILKTTIPNTPICVDWGSNNVDSNRVLKSYLGLSKMVNDKLDSIRNCIYNTNPIAIYTNLEKDESFNFIINTPASQGASIYKIDRFLITLFKGFLPVVKSDKIHLSIYNYNPLRKALLYRFTIEKKNSNSIDVYTTALDLLA